jgi:rare lipoprotein A
MKTQAAISFILCFVTLLLDSCSSIPRNVPPSSSDANALPGNKSPYIVFGKTYEILPDSLEYLEIGIASWYGNKFHGRLTANGEKYDMYRLSAAHKTLPLPTVVRVTNLDNGKRVTLRVNDRGPFHADRVIDLSYRAAIELGFVDKGTAPVVVEAVDALNYPGRDLGPPEGSQPVEGSQPAEGSLGAEGSRFPKSKPASPLYFLQAGAFSRVESAELLLSKIRELLSVFDAGIQARILQSELDLGILHKVWIGPIGTQAEEEKISALVRKITASETIKIEL